MVRSFPVLFEATHPFGVLVGVKLPGGAGGITDLADVLSPRELEVAAALRGLAVQQWIGGRVAAHVAAGALGAERWELLRGASGEPLPPPGWSASISHKWGLAVALVARGMVDIGVDVEADAGAAREIEHLVFTQEERQGWGGMASEEQARARVVAFALKEAAYKALSAPSGRALRFTDAAVDVSVGHPAITIRDGGPSLEVACQWRDGRVIAAVRAEPRSQWRSPWCNAR
jgi:4'-phosphopantetheinyl transferase EntD